MSRDANDILLDRGVDGLRRDWDTSFEVRPPDDGAKLLDDVHAFLGRYRRLPIQRDSYGPHALDRPRPSDGSLGVDAAHCISVSRA